MKTIICVPDTSETLKSKEDENFEHRKETKEV